MNDSYEIWKKVLESKLEQGELFDPHEETLKGVDKDIAERLRSLFKSVKSNRGEFIKNTKKRKGKSPN